MQKLGWLSFRLEDVLWTDASDTNVGRGKTERAALEAQPNMLRPPLRMRSLLHKASIQKYLSWRRSPLEKRRQRVQLGQDLHTRLGRAQTPGYVWPRAVRENLQRETKVDGKGSGSQTLQYEATWKRIVHTVGRRSFGT